MARRQGAGDLCLQLPDGPPPGRARRALYAGLQARMGHARQRDRHLPIICRETDRGCYALVTDLKQRGMLDDTLVVWAGEFGRTVYSQGGLTPDNYGRDHHPRCYTTWMAGGGVRPASPTARPTTTATTWSRIRSQCATSTRPFCTAWASTTTSSRITFRGSIKSSPAPCRPALSRPACVVRLDGKPHADWQQFLGRFHPLVVHLPIGLLLLVPLLELAGTARPALREAAASCSAWRSSAAWARCCWASCWPMVAAPRGRLFRDTWPVASP
jgi:hypothetical protein